MIVGVQFKCDGCDALMAVPVKLEPGPRSSLLRPVLAPVIEVPKGWRRAHGASGRGLFHLCDGCEARKVRIDDTGAVLSVDVGGFHDD